MWNVKRHWDDLFFAVCNILFRLRYLKQGGAKGHGLVNNIELKNRHKNARVCVVGNGPSIQKQDLKRLKNEITFFVNRGFLHPDYQTIKPTYHVFVDPKMATGEWPLSFLDEAAEKNSDVTFLLNGRWFGLPEFQEYKKKYRIYWLEQSLFLQPWYRKAIDLTTIGIGGAVVEQAIIAALYMGSKDVYFTGVDGNGLCYSLTGESSHYYGSNPEDAKNSFQTTVTDLAMMSNSLRRWSMLTKYCGASGIAITNLTDGGIINCCKRGEFSALFNRRPI